MRTQIKNSVRFFAFALALSAMFFWGCSCTTSKSPLASWHGLGIDPHSVDKVIQDDYQDFIQKLPPNQKGYYVGEINFFDNETRQHAVSIQIFANNKPAVWYYALIYDKDDKRIKIIKYSYGSYQS